MSGYVLTPLAKADVFDIWSYIADDSEDAADRVELAIYEACAFVAEEPSRRHSSYTPATTLRFWTLTRYPNTPLSTGPKPLPLRLSRFCMAKEIFHASC